MRANLGAGGGGVVDMATGGTVDDSRGWGVGGYSCQEDGDVRGQRNGGEGGGGQNGRLYVGRVEWC